MLIIGNGSVITRDPELPYLADGAVAVQGEEILAVGPCADLKAAKVVWKKSNLFHSSTF